MKRVARTHKRRGSALIFVSIMLVAITAIVVASAQLSLATGEKASRVVTDAKAQATFDAEVALVAAANKSNSLTVPYTTNFTLNGYTINVNVQDNSGVMDRTLLVTANGPLDDKPFTFSRVVGGRQRTHPLYYALFCDGVLDGNANAISTTNIGHVYARGTIDVGPTCSIDGDIVSNELITDTGAANVRNEVSYGPSIMAAGFDYEDYKNQGTTLLNILGLTTVSFLSVLLGQPYPIAYCDGNTNVSGLFIGKGTLVIKGNCTITGDITPVLGAKVLVLVDGILTINSSVNNISGWWYATNDIKALSGGTLHVNGGSLVSAKRLRFGRPVDVTFDRTLFYSRNEALRFRAPGFWPTLDPNLTR